MAIKGWHEAVAAVGMGLSVGAAAFYIGDKAVENSQDMNTWVVECEGGLPDHMEVSATFPEQCNAFDTAFYDSETYDPHAPDPFPIKVSVSKSGEYTDSYILQSALSFHNRYYAEPSQIEDEQLTAVKDGVEGGFAGAILTGLGMEVARRAAERKRQKAIDRQVEAEKDELIAAA